MIRGHLLHFAAFCCSSLLLWPAFVHAAPVYNTSAALTGVRTVSPPAAGRIATNDDDWLDGVLEWTIIDNLNGTFTYTYEFRNFDRPGISHFTLDVSDSAIGDPGLIVDPLLNGVTPIVTEFGNIEGITGAVKFDLGADGDITYSFTSNRLPVYGHFTLKAGRSTVANNTGFDNEASESVLDFIARPDTILIINQEIPVMDAPSSIALFSMGMASLGMLRLRRRTSDVTRG